MSRWDVVDECRQNLRGRSKDCLLIAEFSAMKWGKVPCTHNIGREKGHAHAISATTIQQLGLEYRYFGARIGSARSLLRFKVYRMHHAAVSGMPTVVLMVRCVRPALDTQPFGGSMMYR